MSVQITKQNNFYIINISGVAPYREVSQSLNQYGLWEKLDFVAYAYDRDNAYVDFIKEKTIYVIYSNNAYYTLSSKGEKIVITKRTFYDENNPHTNQTKWYKEDDEETSEYDKKFHVDDKMVYIDTLDKYFAIQNQKHGLYHGSTFYLKWYNSKPYPFRPWEKYKDDLFALANELIEEIKMFENVETLVNLDELGIIPKPNIQYLKRGFNNKYSTTKTL